jgi:hypothetical protein
MATYESTHGSVVHVELYSEDPEATRAFSETVFGWSVEPVEGMEEEYDSWRAPNPPGGGIVGLDGPFATPSTVLYLDVDDLGAAVASIVDAGGEILMEETAVPEMGVFAVFRDPGGVVSAAWEDRYEGEPPEGGWPAFTDDPEPGSVAHFELYSDDPAATRRLYDDVFGWTFEEVGDGDDEYTMARPPTPPYGGLVAVTDEMVPGTMLFVLVDDAGDASRVVADAGGRLLREPFDIEGWGRMAVLEAPGGVVQAVWENRPGDDGSASAATVPDRETVDRAGRSRS